MVTTTDARGGTRNRNLSNTDRFKRRFREQIKDYAKKKLGDRSITDETDQDVVINSSGTDEPQIIHDRKTGDYDYSLPGNKQYQPNDTLPKPRGGEGGGGREGSPDGDGEDEFRFAINYDEFLDVIFDGLDLPDLIKKSEAFITEHTLRRAGFTSTGSPTNLNVEKTSMAAMGRRIALGLPSRERIEELEEEIRLLLLEDDGSVYHAEELAARQELLELLKARKNKISYFDEVDLRFNNFVPQQKRITKAAMFCLMDVSGSMTERHKRIAKKFFILLYLFLKRRYKDGVEVIFVRHDDEAETCDEKTFFEDPKTGGTVVSAGYAEVLKQINDRFSSDVNIYLAQASDGDNNYSDTEAATGMLAELADLCQFIAYVEIASGRYDSEAYYSMRTELAKTFEKVADGRGNMDMRQIGSEDEIVGVFRKFFERKATK